MKFSNILILIIVSVLCFSSIASANRELNTQDNERLCGQCLKIVGYAISRVKQGEADTQINQTIKETCLNPKDDENSTLFFCKQGKELVPTALKQIRKGLSATSICETLGGCKF